MAISHTFFKHFPSVYPFQTVKFFLLAIIITVLAFGCKKKAQNPSPNPQPSPELEWPSLSGPYFGQVPPDSVPLVFGPGYISTDQHFDFSAGFSQNMDEFYFTRRKDGERNKLYVTRLLNGNWAEPVQIMENILAASESFITLDNQYLYFGTPDGLYSSKRDSVGNWGNAQFFGPGMYVSSTLDSLVFFTDVSVGYDQAFLVKREPINGIYGNQHTVTFSGPLQVRQHTFMAPDKSFLIYDSYNDIYYATFIDTTQLGSPGIKLNNSINSTLDEITPYVSPDGKYFFFSRDGKIYWVDMKYIF